MRFDGLCDAVLCLRDDLNNLIRKSGDYWVDFVPRCVGAKKEEARHLHAPTEAHLCKRLADRRLPCPRSAIEPCEPSLPRYVSHKPIEEFFEHGLPCTLVAARWVNALLRVMKRRRSDMLLENLEAVLASGDYLAIYQSMCFAIRYSKVFSLVELLTPVKLPPFIIVCAALVKN